MKATSIVLLLLLALSLFTNITPLLASAKLIYARSYYIDEGFDSSTGLSRWVVARHGNTGHVSTGGVGGAEGYYWGGQCDDIHVLTPSLPKADKYFVSVLYRIGKQCHKHEDFRVKHGGIAYDFIDDETNQYEWTWTIEMEFNFGTGVNIIILENIGSNAVDYEKILIKATAEPKPREKAQYVTANTWYWNWRFGDEASRFPWYNITSALVYAKIEETDEGYLYMGPGLKVTKFWYSVDNGKTWTYYGKWPE